MRYTNPLYTPFLNPLSNELYRLKKKYEKGTSAEPVVSSYLTSRQDTEGQGTCFNCVLKMLSWSVLLSILGNMKSIFFRLMPAFSVFAGLLGSFTEENGPWLIYGVASKLVQNLCEYLRQRHDIQEQLRNCTCVQTTLLNQFPNAKATQRGPKSILSHDHCTMWTRMGCSYCITSPLVLVWLCKTWKIDW